MEEHLDSETKSLPPISELIAKVNKTLPLHNMWDGLWVHAYKRNNLVISAALDRSARRDYDIVFKKTIFFNLPASWRDDDIIGDNLIRLASNEEFALQQPDFDTKNLPIFAFDIGWTIGQESRIPYTYYVVAKTLWLFKCEGEDCKYGGAEFIDPWAVNGYPQLIAGKPCLQNRITAL
jgi:hypothetical protein